MSGTEESRHEQKGPNPTCPGCGRPAVLVDGARIYLHREDLHAKRFWVCEPCAAWCGCHPGSTRPLGFPAGVELRKARSILHDRRIDPLWKNAVATCGYRPDSPKAMRIILNTARSRVYAFLAWKLGLDREDCHTAMFDIETCRRAWAALSGIDYPAIRAWAKARKSRVAADRTSQQMSAAGGAP